MIARCIGAKLFYLGFRMQPLRIRRAISLLLAVGLEWQKQNEDILTRAMDGEHLNLAVGFKTEEVNEDGSAVVGQSR